MNIRLDKYISDAAALTRSEARKAIKDGNVKIGEEVIKNISRKVAQKDCVKLNDKEVAYKKYIYIMLNKPSGYISATEDKKQKTVMNLIDESYSRYQLFPVGRLDIDTEGFLLLTNDGSLSHDLLSPNKKVGKTYFVRLKEEISDEKISLLEGGVDIGECITKGAVVERVSKNEIHLTITEGKFHQIKRMAKAVGNEVLYLRRLSYGNLYIDKTLQKGDYRCLTDEETALLYQCTGKKQG